MTAPLSEQNEKDLVPLDDSTMKSLEEIERTLQQMLLLAELSASDANVDRAQLQATLERLREKIDHLADQL